MVRLFPAAGIIMVWAHTPDAAVMTTKSRTSFLRLRMFLLLIAKQGIPSPEVLTVASSRGVRRL
jgi:hypothetical protein